MKNDPMQINASFVTYLSEKERHGGDGKLAQLSEDIEEQIRKVVRKLELESDCHSCSFYFIGGVEERKNAGRCKVCDEWVSAQNRPRIIQGLGIGAVHQGEYYCDDHLPEESEAFVKLFPFGRNYEHLPPEQLPTESDDGIGWLNVETSDITTCRDTIKDALDTVNDQLKGRRARDSMWTKKIKESLVELGNKRGLSCYASGVENVSSGEWLYDLCWISYRDDTNVGYIELAMESEWIPSLKEIRDDFVKLVQARAGLRLMIWQAETRGDMDDIVRELINQIHCFEFTRHSDAYLLSCWIAEEQGFCHKFYEYPGN